jgi:hypothetical protein
MYLTFCSHRVEIITNDTKSNWVWTYFLDQCTNQAHEQVSLWAPPACDNTPVHSLAPYCSPTYRWCPSTTTMLQHTCSQPSAILQPHIPVVPHPTPPHPFYLSLKARYAESRICMQEYQCYVINTFRPGGVLVLRGLSSHQSGAL